MITRTFNKSVLRPIILAYAVAIAVVSVTAIVVACYPASDRSDAGKDGR